MKFGEMGFQGFFFPEYVGIGCIMVFNSFSFFFLLFLVSFFFLFSLLVHGRVCCIIFPAL